MTQPSLQMPPEFVPEYNKPDAPGITMNFDNSVSIYYVVNAQETFEAAALSVFNLLREAQDRYPGWSRVLYLDIEGHVDQQGNFEDDFVEFQQELLFSTVAPFLCAFETPLTGGLINPDPQRNDVPDELVIRPPQGPVGLN